MPKIVFEMNVDDARVVLRALRDVEQDSFMRMCRTFEDSARAEARGGMSEYRTLEAIARYWRQQRATMLYLHERLDMLIAETESPLAEE